MARPGPLAVLVGALTLSMLSGCITGERPTLSESPGAPGEPTGDGAVDAVLTLLDAAATARFSADYTVLTRFGGTNTDAEVIQLSPDRRTVTVGDIQFRVDGDDTSTCNLGSGDCASGVQERRISDVQITHRFYAEQAAIRLRRDAQARIGNTDAQKTRIAGRPATCVSIPQDGGTVQYCALDSGVLALVDDADVHIELTSYDDSVAESDLAAD
ncbi:MAG: hypothetical protein M3337_05340 [Actinomycetota bacterium]|nr:hypothetical protein [Actinomycetota bacterium]